MLAERAADEAEGRTPWFPALRHRNFRLFVVGQGLSLVGFWMQSVGQSWLVYRLSDSPLALGFVAFAGYLPILALSPVAGVFVDRTRRRPLLLVTQSLLLLLALGLGILVALRVATVGAIVAFAFGVGLVSSIDVPARQAFLVEMTGPADLPGAIALNSSIFNTARMVGPVMAGVVLGAVGEAACFFVNAASYVAVLWALLRMRLPADAPAPPAHALRAELRSGLEYVWRDRALRDLLLLLGVVGAFGLPYQVLMPVFARTVFAAGPRAYGLLLTAAGVGAVASSLLLASRTPSRDAHRGKLLDGLVLFALGVLGLAVTRSLALAVASQVVAGFGMIRYTTTTNTLLQLLAADDYRGRVMGLHTVMFLGTAPAGSLLLGGLAERFGAPTAALVSGAVSLAAAGSLAVGRRRRAARRAA
ncbi:MAG TPA: MFS transporter [Candidatus Binatia bacterium]|nr:MFS transporter [Candidatus Binatia bacterium]